MPFAAEVAKADLVYTEAFTPDLAQVARARMRIESLAEEEFDQLPFGAIQLDTKGVVLRYNEYESNLSGIGKPNAVGKHFFTQLAPCTNVQEFYGRFKEGVSRKRMYEKFRYHFAFKRRPRDVTITLFYSDITESIWVFVRPV